MPNTAENTSPEAFTLHHIDHVVFTVKDPVATANFYQRITGMTPERFGQKQERLALKFGEQKLNLHQAGAEFKPHATYPTPGSVDICFITEQPLDEAMASVQSRGIKIEEGPVQRTGAKGPIRSFYFRDPDGNLIEVANYPKFETKGNLDQVLSAVSTGATTWAAASLATTAAQRVLSSLPRARGLAGAAGLLAAVGSSLWNQPKTASKVTPATPGTFIRFNR